jgi:hypothetical protein
MIGIGQLADAGDDPAADGLLRPGRGCRRPVPPQQVDEPVHRDGMPGLDHQDRRQRHGSSPSGGDGVHLSWRLGRLGEATERSRAGLARETRVASRVWINRTKDLVGQIISAP